MPGLLDDYGSLLGPRPKILPPGAGLDPTAQMGVTAGDELDPTMGARRAEALEVRGNPPPNVPGGTLAGPNQQRAFAFGDQPTQGFPARNLSIAQADAAPPKTNLAELGFGLGDHGFPTPKLTARMPEGNPMTGPQVAGGPPSLLDPSPQFAPTPASASPALPTPAGGPPMPPPRPPGIGGPPPTQLAGGPPTPKPMTPGGNPAPQAPPPNPILPPQIGAPPPGMGGGPPTPAPITPPVSTPAPIAAAPAAATAAAAPAAAGAAGGAAGGLGGIFSGLAGIAKGLQGKPAPAPPPPPRAPQIQPMQPDTASAGRAQGAQQALGGQLGGGLLSSPTLIDPRKRMQGLA